MNILIVDMSKGETLTEEAERDMADADIILTIETDGHVKVTNAASNGNGRQVNALYHKALTEAETSLALAKRHLDARERVKAIKDNVESEDPVSAKFARVWES